MRVLRAAWVVPVATEAIRDGAVAVADGRVEMVAPASDVRAAHPRADWEDLGEVVLAPGLIDVHCHLEWSLVGGLFSGAQGFGRWVGGLLSLWPIREGLLDAAARLAALRSLQAGTTTVVDNGPTGAGVAALTASGQRGIVHLEAFAGDSSVAGRAAKAAEEGIVRLAEGAGPRVAVGVSPHAPYSAGPDLWHALASGLPEGLSWSTHIAESLDERRAMTDGGGPLVDAFAPGGMTIARWPGNHGGSSVKAMADAGALREGLLAAHLVHVDSQDMELLASHGVRGAHCPISNATLRCGRSPLEGLRAAGVRVALGTDSPSSAGTYDLRAEARACQATHACADVHFTPAELLRMCTVDAAAVLGRDDIGSIANGARADLVALRPRPEATPGDPCAAVMDAGTTVEHVWVDGEPLLRDGYPTRLDHAAIEGHAQEMRRAVC